MSAILTSVLGFVGAQVKGYFDDRREYRRQRNEMASNGLASSGGTFIIVTWLAPMWLIAFEVLWPAHFAGKSGEFFAALDSAPQWYFGTAVSLSLFAFGADQMAKLPKAWGKK